MSWRRSWTYSGVKGLLDKTVSVPGKPMRKIFICSLKRESEMGCFLTTQLTLLPCRRAEKATAWSKR
jgi:hypothetical protein